MGVSGVIVVGVDGSETSHEALRWAATVPTAFSGSVEVRPVVQIPDSAAEVPG